MSEITALPPVIRAWLLEGPLSSYVPSYVARLRRGRYAACTTGHCLNGVAHFSHWMTQCFLPVQLLNDGCIDQFLRYHLPRCDCPGEALRTPKSLHAALTALLVILRERGVIAELPTPAGPIADELRNYDTNMRDARGLAEGTRRGYLRVVERLLLYKFAGRPVVFGEVQPEDVRRFIANQMESLSSISNATTIAVTLRAYLRYRAACGDAVQPLLAVIGTTAHWSLASLPRALKAEEVDRLLSSFTATLPSARRGYAVVRLALDLGLRSIEINRLQLADIDWRKGTVTLKRTKSRQQEVLPLPVDTGRALEAYVRHERPETDLGAVFVRRLAPHDKPMGVHGIRRLVRDAFLRVGIPHGRSHALRHTLACRIVNQGGSIKEVADVLRHRSLDTSLIYAKLDHGALAGVALPWPGSAP
ncbi:MAG: tyrosine-type recombinase/integrase [Rhodoferax sp.]|nr:tyrosine-type recombinase/integrase [Rhodoferax sp.]